MAFAHRQGDPASTPAESLDLGAVQRMRLEMGATVADLVATDVEIATEALMRAAKTAYRHGDIDIHLQVTKRRESLQDLMTFLSDRSGA